LSASALLNLNIDFSEIDLMNIAAYKAIYQRFGLLATLHDFCISAIEKIVRFRLLLIYVHKNLGPINTPPIPGLDIRVMSAEELEAHVGAPGLDLPRSHIEQALANGDKCIGAFLDNQLCSYAWYAHNASTSSNRLVTRFSSDYAYTYKNLTLPAYRGRGIQRWVKNYALSLYQAEGKKGVIVAIDSNNFSSRRTTAAVGAKVTAYFAYFLGQKRYVGFNVWGSKKLGYRLEKAENFDA